MFPGPRAVGHDETRRSAPQAAPALRWVRRSGICRHRRGRVGLRCCGTLRPVRASHCRARTTGEQLLVVRQNARTQCRRRIGGLCSESRVPRGLARHAHPPPEHARRRRGCFRDTCEGSIVVREFQAFHQYLDSKEVTFRQTAFAGGAMIASRNPTSSLRVSSHSVSRSVRRLLASVSVVTSWKSGFSSWHRFSA
jgi:hypothetical protein